MQGVARHKSGRVPTMAQKHTTKALAYACIVLLTNISQALCASALAFDYSLSVPAATVSSAAGAAAFRFGRVFKGVASWYGAKFHGHRTASGTVYDENKFTCAHRSLPFGTKVHVTNPANGAQCTVTVTDRGPYKGNRVIDLSRAAARKLGIIGLGHVICSTRHYIAGRFSRGKGHALQTASTEGVAKAKEVSSDIAKSRSGAPKHTEKTVALADAGRKKTRKKKNIFEDDQSKYLNSPYYVIKDDD